MFDLQDDGSIGIDFSTAAEDGTETERLVRLRPVPRIGTYKRLRAELAAVGKKQDEFAEELRNDPDVTVAEMNRMLNERYEDDSVGWWLFVFNGDESFAGLAEGDVPDPDDWPPYMTTNASVQSALAHWKSVPLARGGKPILTS